MHPATHGDYAQATVAELIALRRLSLAELEATNHQVVDVEIELLRRLSNLHTMQTLLTAKLSAVVDELIRRLAVEPLAGTTTTTTTVTVTPPAPDVDPLPLDP
jgi:phosphoglycolate phosphatase-like HAD superfamily hydrolase